VHRRPHHPAAEEGAFLESRPFDIRRPQVTIPRPEREPSGSLILVLNPADQRGDLGGPTPPGGPVEELGRRPKAGEAPRWDAPRPSG
jgi:hypothetical protein